MSAVEQLVMTEEEYLRRERLADTKSEFDRGHVYAMAGASRFHNAVKDNLITLFNLQLNPHGCRTYSADMKVWSPRTRLFTYPDLVIVCGKEQYKDDRKDILLNPKVIVEILSPSSEARDRILKFRGYIAIDSVQEYLLVSQNDAFIQRLVREPGGQWVMTPFDGLDVELTLSSVPARIPMQKIYWGLDFSPPSDTLTE